MAANNLSPDELSLVQAPYSGEVYWPRGFVAHACNYFGVPRTAVSFTYEPFGFTQAIARGEQNYLDPRVRARMGLRAYRAYLANRNFGVSTTKHRVAVITHSMGAAYSLGIMSGMAQNGILVGMSLHINPFQPDGNVFEQAHEFGHAVHCQTKNDYVVRPIPAALLLLAKHAGPGLWALERAIKQPGKMRSVEEYQLLDGPKIDNWQQVLSAHVEPLYQPRDFWRPDGKPRRFGGNSQGMWHR